MTPERQTVSPFIPLYSEPAFLITEKIQLETKTNLKRLKKQLKSNLIESKLIFHSDTDAAAGAAAASAVATVATTTRLVLKQRQLQKQ